MLGGALGMCLLLEHDVRASIPHGKDAQQQTLRDDHGRADPDDPGPGGR
jgi:hypothetical protein